VAVVFCCHGCVGKFNQSRIGTYQPGRPRSTQATLALLGAAARPPLLVVHLPQPCPFEPQPPSRGELLHRLFAAWRHPCARPELGRRDMEGGDGPMPPAHLGPARNAHQRADDSFAAGDEKMVGGRTGAILSARERQEGSMTAFNAVRFHVKPGRDQEFLDAHKGIDQLARPSSGQHDQNGRADLLHHR
jgi:hypothetical protein